MRPLLIIDTETTGLDPEKDRIIEVGAVLFDPEAGVPVACGSRLIQHPNAPKADNPAEAINRIPESVLSGPWPDYDPATLLYVMDELCDGTGIVGKSDAGLPYLVAHNAAFDSSFLDVDEDRTWICTKHDVEWDRVPGGTGSLVQIALAYDVGVVRAHRAIEDCLTLAAILSRVHALENGLERWIERALEPRVEVVVAVSYDNRQLAKDRGFTWNAETKTWSKRVRESVLDEYCESLPFSWMQR